ncbi:MAG TPA: replication factor C large subunit [Methanoregula sp.]|nr:replication factor C large subunit [Methanoregula sp.]
MDWTEKYRPAHLADIVGNTSAVRQIAGWAKGWSRHAKPLLLYGKPGIGKTSSAYALANDMGWEVIELNASDQRTAGVIERIAGEGSATASLTGASRKLIVIDEADNLQGTSDRGGAKAIVECIKQARQPLILIANDLYGISPEIRSRCEPVQFRAIPARSIAPRLRYLCSAEKVSCTDAAIHAIAESAEGDVRSAVNMLYASAIGRDRIDDAQVHTSQKDERVSIFSLISATFAKTTDRELMRLSREVEDTPETVEQWLEGSIPLLRDAASMAAAYRNLARADEYLGYTYRRQYHTLWRYAGAIMLLGTADAAGGAGIHARIMPPERWQKMAAARKQKAIRVALLNKVAGMMNIPQNTLREEYLGTIAMIVAHDPGSYARELTLDADQLNYFLNDRAKAQEIVRAIQQETKEKEKEKRKEEEKEKKKEEERAKKREEERAGSSRAASEPGKKRANAEKAGEKPFLREEARPDGAAPPAPLPESKKPGQEETPAKKGPAPSQSTFDSF